MTLVSKGYRAGNYPDEQKKPSISPIKAITTVKGIGDVVRKGLLTKTQNIISNKGYLDAGGDFGYIDKSLSFESPAYNVPQKMFKLVEAPDTAGEMISNYFTKPLESVPEGMELTAEYASYLKTNPGEAGAFVDKMKAHNWSDLEISNKLNAVDSKLGNVDNYRQVIETYKNSNDWQTVSSADDFSKINQMGYDVTDASNKFGFGQNQQFDIIDPIKSKLQFTGDGSYSASELGIGSEELLVEAELGSKTNLQIGQQAIDAGELPADLAQGAEVGSDIAEVVETVEASKELTDVVQTGTELTEVVDTAQTTVEAMELVEAADLAKTTADAKTLADTAQLTEGVVETTTAAVSPSVIGLIVMASLKALGAADVFGDEEFNKWFG